MEIQSLIQWRTICNQSKRRIGLTLYGSGTKQATVTVVNVGPDTN
jgi:hypothetical protein